jgi:DNA-binding IclR family transcriptional regulator
MIAPAKFEASQALDRVLAVIEVLQGSGRPLSTGTLCNALADRTGRDWSRDTLARDLRLLAARGLVAQSGEGRGATVTWRWLGRIDLRPAV